MAVVTSLFLNCTVDKFSSFQSPYLCFLLIYIAFLSLTKYFTLSDIYDYVNLE